MKTPLASFKSLVRFKREEVISVVTLLLPSISADRNNRIVIESGVRTVVMCLDVLHIYCGLDLRHLVYLLDVVAQVRILMYELLVGFKVHHVYLIEADQCDE